MVPACILSGVLSLYCSLLPHQLILLVLMLAGSLWIIRKMFICPLLSFGYLAWCACLYSDMGGGDRRTTESAVRLCCMVSHRPASESKWRLVPGMRNQNRFSCMAPFVSRTAPSKVRQLSHAVVFSILYCPAGCGELFSEYYSARKCSNTETFRLELGSLSSQGSRGRCPFLQLQLQ